MKKSFAWIMLLALLLTQVNSATSSNSNSITGCVNKKTALLRIAEKCTSAEKKIVWGVAGPAGKDGLNGKDGVDGVDGIDGIDGKAGLDGQNGINGRDGVPGIAGPRGETGKDGSQNTIYWAYLKSKEIQTNGSRRFVILNSKNLNLPVAPLGQDYKFQASVNLTTRVNAQTLVGCYWTNQATLDKGSGGWGAFDTKQTVGFSAILNPTAVMYLENASDEKLLVCTIPENASITGGYVSAEAVISSFKGTIGE
jgi:hypothetical protein